MKGNRLTIVITRRREGLGFRAVVMTQDDVQGMCERDTGPTCVICFQRICGDFDDGGRTAAGAPQPPRGGAAARGSLVIASLCVDAARCSSSQLQAPRGGRPWPSDNAWRFMKAGFRLSLLGTNFQPN